MIIFCLIFSQQKRDCCTVQQEFSCVVQKGNLVCLASVISLWMKFMKELRKGQHFLLHVSNVSYTCKPPLPHRCTVNALSHQTFNLQTSSQNILRTNWDYSQTMNRFTNLQSIGTLTECIILEQRVSMIVFYSRDWLPLSQHCHQFILPVISLHPLSSVFWSAFCLDPNPNVQRQTRHQRQVKTRQCLYCTISMQEVKYKYIKKLQKYMYAHQLKLVE